jgi:DNA-binding SARP family transcriptional activator
MSLAIRVLGPLEVRHASHPLRLPAGRPATFLAAMALSANRVVPLPVLVEELWGRTPPRSARYNLRSYASQLRKGLGGYGRLTARGGGYVLEPGDGEVDAETFEALLAEAAGVPEPPRAAALLDRALALWRGPVLADVAAGPLITARSTVLEELRVTAVEDHVAALLRLADSRPGDLAVRLRQHLAEHPYRERGWGQLMLALYRAGDPAAALDAYAQARRVLADDLGIAPGPELTALHRALLDRDPELSGLAGSGPPAARPTAVARVSVPHQLPPAPTWFVGRDVELDRIRRCLTGSGGPTVVVVTGPPGVGKSALALAAAHEAAGAYPDGQLYADLDRASASAEVLGHCLRALDHRRPHATDAAEFRSTAYGRRLLLVLDNADRFAGLEDLVPTGPHCAVLITRRSVPAQLDAVDVALSPLSGADAVELIGRVAGASRIAAEPAATTTVAELCDRLPLAVRAAAVRLARRPDWPVAGLAARLGPEHRRLDELRSSPLDVRERYASACRALGPAGPALRRLALLQVPQCRPEVLAALLAAPPGAADEALDVLVTERLVEPLRGGRFRLPGLLRAYGAELARESEPAHERRAALLRAFCWYASGAEQAVRAAPAGRAWLDRERGSLLAVARQAARLPGAERIVVRIATSLRGYLSEAGDEHDARALRRLALGAGQRLDVAGGERGRCGGPCEGAVLSQPIGGA